ncbi:ADP-ribosylation/crystallin J1 [Virgisporangium ochraceum]|uniref:ADP-ribosylation/crystallin J1 n=1 Tax=Virgisporangium ochraceum TaxID=65505 RepID=UPI0019417DE7|nr:ADP-ribosylation/crystallin J1 [Virgisporangium ochraceum]
METVTLWRPIGPEELALVEASGWRRWPPRLAEQPVFYPVLNEEYATMIARDWNVKHSGVGYVTRFEVTRDFLDRYEVHQVGGRTILEYWIPAEDLERLNDNIVGTIDVVAEYR